MEARNAGRPESAGAAGFELEGVAVRYGGEAALEEVTLRIAPGEALALVGPSGAGKTTLLRLFNATLLAHEGRVRVDGQDLAALDGGRLRALRARLGHVTQDMGLVPNLRVAQNVLAGRLGRKGREGSLASVLWPRRRALDEVHALLARLGIAEKLFQRVDALSGGEQRRVAVARALYQEPAALLADEPLASLDPARARETLELLIGVARERGLTLVLSMHEIELARELVPRLVGLREGRVVFDCASSALEGARYEELYRLAEGARDGHGR